jgi:hypothetical protein
MGKRQRIWAAKARRELRRKLGMKCAACGSKFYLHLEFDIINPKAPGVRPHHREMEWSWRISFYRQQHQLGNVQLLCGYGAHNCHNRKTYEENYENN